MLYPTEHQLLGYLGEIMLPKIVKANSLKEILTPEGCYLYENYGISQGDSKVSIARARVKSGVTTKPHRLEGIQEIYLITKGKGVVNIEGLNQAEVEEGDSVIIPPGKSQQITNKSKTDLVFYCICTPSFKQECYSEENIKNTTEQA